MSNKFIFSTLPPFSFFFRYPNINFHIFLINFFYNTLNILFTYFSFTMTTAFPIAPMMFSLEKYWNDFLDKT